MVGKAVCLGWLALLGLLPVWSQDGTTGEPSNWYEAYQAPGDRPRGLAFDGTYLWSNDFGAMKLYRHRVDSNLTVVETYDLTDRYNDLTWDGQSLYAIQWGRVDKLELPGPEVTRSWSRPAEFHHMHGLAWNGTYLLTAHVSTQIYEHQLDEAFTILQTYEHSDNSGGMTWDGQYLYVVSTMTHSITKLSLEGGQATAVARYCTPGPVPTGIAWDGQHFWVADDATNKIYKILEFQEDRCDSTDIVLEPGTTTTPLSGRVDGNLVLTAAQSPYLLQGTLEVAPGATLTIEPGTTIYAASPEAAIMVRGALSAVGTQDAPIVLTHANANETWHGLRLESAAGPNVIEFVKMLYAGIGILDSPVVVRYSHLRYNSGIGAFFYTDFSDSLIIEGNTIAYTFGAGINVSALQQDELQGHMRGSVVVRYNHFTFAGPVDLGNYSQWSGRAIVTNNIIDNEFGVSISLGSTPWFSVNENFMDIVDTGIGVGSSVESTRTQEIRRNLIRSCQSSAIPMFFAGGGPESEYRLHENTVIRAQYVSSIQQDPAAPTSVTIVFTDNNFIDAPLIGGIPNHPVDGSNNWWGSMPEEEVVNWHQDAPGYGSVQVLPVRTEPVPVGYVTGVLSDATGKPLVGATVQLQGTSFTTKTAVDGTFFLAADAGQYVLEVRDRQEAEPPVTAGVVVVPADLTTCGTADGQVSCATPITGVAANDPVPAAAYLQQNYPNPFNPTTAIPFVLPRRGRVTLKVFNVLGREVATLVDKELGPGKHVVVFDGKDLASGLYFYKLQAGRFVGVKKMMLLK